jgi:hypothetical protein
MLLIATVILLQPVLSNPDGTRDDAELGHDPWRLLQPILAHER